MLSNNDLFLQTILDIKDKLEKFSTYNSIRVAGLIRHLLLDNPSLLTLVNREQKQKIVFRVSTKMTPPKVPSMFIAYIIPDDNSFMELNLSKFLSLNVVFINDETYSVAEIIKVVAHTFGGVHSYSQYEKEKRLDRLNQTLHLFPKGTIPNLCYLIKEIGIVVIKTLDGLQNSIQARTTTGGF